MSPVYCFVYLRISKDDELEGNGVDNQLRVCTAKLPVGWEILDVINDNDTSATSDKPREGYELMLARLRAGEAQGVLGFAQDRVTRKVEEAAALLSLVDSHGVQIAISDTGVLPLKKGNFDARANFLTNTVNARRETEAVSARVTLNCEGRALKGRPQGKVPFGYRRHPLTDEQGQVILNHKGRIKEKVDVIHEPEAAVIRWAAEQALAGRSVRSITAELDRGEIRPVGGGRWDVRQTRRILTMPTYAGLRIYLGKVIGDATWPAIITEAQHQRLTKLFADPRRKASYMGRPPRWLLSGIAECGICGPGSRIGAQHDNRPNRNATSVYRCCWADSDHPGCHGSINLLDADQWISLAIKAELADPKLGEPSADVAERIDGLYDRITEIKAELAEIADDDDLDYAQIKIMSAKRKVKIKGIEDQISALLPQVARHTQLDWDSADIGGKRDVIRSMVKSITLHPSRVMVGRKRGFTPDQIRIEWR
jgi:DNA invertase Pin-like site-specific DNA recombinase